MVPTSALVVTDELQVSLSDILAHIKENGHSNFLQQEYEPVLVASDLSVISGHFSVLSLIALDVPMAKVVEVEPEENLLLKSLSMGIAA